MKTMAAVAFVTLGACQTAQGGEGASASPPSVLAQASPIDELDRLDQRNSLRLLPMMAHHQKQNMREHLVVVQEIVAATGTGDFAKVAQSAQRVGSSEVMNQMCEHMGTGAPGFAEQALAFHHAADRIGDAARHKDTAAVLTALGDTLAKCTACHAAYKQKLVDKL